MPRDKCFPVSNFPYQAWEYDNQYPVELLSYNHTVADTYNRYSAPTYIWHCTFRKRCLLPLLRSPPSLFLATACHNQIEYTTPVAASVQVIGWQHPGCGSAQYLPGPSQIQNDLPAHRCLFHTAAFWWFSSRFRRAASPTRGKEILYPLNFSDSKSLPKISHRCIQQFFHRVFSSIWLILRNAMKY